MALSVSTPPSVEPISLSEAKLHLKVDHDADDDLISDLIEAARAEAEILTGRTFISTTYVLKLDGFPGSVFSVYQDTGDRIRPPLPPLQSVSSITYVDSDGTTTTATTSLYSVDTSSEPGRISLAYGEAWPTARDIEDAVSITYVAGYGSSASDVPERARALVKLILADLYENRDGSAATPLKENPAVTRLARGLTVPEFP